MESPTVFYALLCVFFLWLVSQLFGGYSGSSSAATWACAASTTVSETGPDACCAFGAMMAKSADSSTMAGRPKAAATAAGGTGIFTSIGCCCVCVFDRRARHSLLRNRGSSLLLAMRNRIRRPAGHMCTCIYVSTCHTILDACIFGQIDHADAWKSQSISFVARI